MLIFAGTDGKKGGEKYKKDIKKECWLK